MPEEFFGTGSILQLQKIFESEKPGKIFLVFGKGAYEKSGAEAAISQLLAGIDVFRFSDFEENPKIEDVRKGIEQLAITHEYSEVAAWITISIGVAEIIPQPSDLILEFIESVDTALYQAKQAGRNRVHPCQHKNSCK